MPSKEFEHFEALVDSLALRLKNCAAGSDAGAIVYELARCIMETEITQPVPRIEDKIEIVSQELSSKTLGVNWTKLFDPPIEGTLTSTSLLMIMKMLWTIGGPRVVGTFFTMKPEYPQTCISFCKAILDIDDATEFGRKFHLPVIIDALDNPHHFNYEPLAPMLLHIVAKAPHYALTDSYLVSFVLAYAAKLSDSELNDAELRALQDSAARFVEHPVPFIDSVVAKIAKNSRLALTAFENVKNTHSFVESIARTNSTVLLEAWAKHETHFRDIIDFLFRADVFYPSPIWSDFLASFAGSDAKAYQTLIDYLPEYLIGTISSDPGAPDGNIGADKPMNPKLSLHIVAAIANLTLTSDLSGADNVGEKADHIHALQLQLLHDYPRFINFGGGHDETILEANYIESFSPDVEAEMKLCFEKMYEQQHDIQEVITLLERLKQSEIPRDQDLFACMIHSLFDEYRFFPQYPVKALATTAVLFGSLIHFRLIEGVPLLIALKFILDSLHQDPDNNMFRFGLQALVEMRQRLPEMPKYCKVLLTIPGIQRHQHFYDQIKNIAQPALGDGDNVSLFRSIFDAGVDETSLQSYISASKGVSEKVKATVNNLTTRNISQKADDMRKELPNQSPINFVKLIVSRACVEHNNHELYSQLLEFLPYDYTVLCIDAVISLVSSLFNSNDTLSVDSRNHIKGLGTFLGDLTLANDRPLIFQQLHLKLLLAEAVRYEKLPAALPFVTRILAQSVKSRAFVKTNPWMSSVLSTLSELYQFGSLPLTLKFEIEVLGNALDIKIEHMKPAFYIRNEVKQQEDAAAILATRGGPAVLNSLPVLVAPQQSVQLGIGLRGSIPASFAGVVPPGFPSAFPQGVNNNIPAIQGIPGTSAANAGASASGANGFMGGMPPGQLPLPMSSGALPPGALPPQVAPGVPIVGTTEFATHPTLRQLLDLSRSKTLQDVLLPVIDRSVSIACFTTKDLVLKDFATESNEAKLQAAAHVPALSLASSMAIVTAKEPFIEALAHNLRTLMISQGYGDSQGLLDQIIIAARETMESLIPLVDSVAREKALIEIEETLMPEFNARQQARQLGRPFNSERSQTSRLSLPESLAIRPGGVTDEQMSVYEQFAVNSYVNEVPILPAPYSISPFGPTVSANGISAELQRLSEEISSLEEQATKSSQRRLGELDNDDDVLQILSKITSFIRNGSKITEEIPLRASHIVVHALFGIESTNSTLYRESLCYLLGELCRMSGLTAKEVVLWLLYADDSKKFNANVIGTLLRGRLVTPTEIDASLTKDISEAATKPEVVDYAARLLLDALVGPEPYCLRSDFAGTILALAKLDTRQFPAAEILIKTLQETRGQGIGNEGHIFAEWTRLMQHHASAYSPALLNTFVKDLHDLGWGSNSEQLMYFVRTAVSVSVKSYIQSKSFVGVDAIAVLITTLLKTVKENNALATSIFTTIVLLVARDHEAGAFESLPYFRLISSIACTLPATYLQEYCSMLLTLQPLAFPGFASSWITLMSHRFVMGRLLASRSQWHLLKDLLEALLCFTRETWLSSSADPAVRGYVFRSLERIFLVILNDEPDFFSKYSNEITALLVSEFVQLRNIVLCAFPEGMELPNPVSDGDANYIDVSEAILESVETARNYLTECNVIKLIENACLPRPQLTPQIVSAIQIAFSYSKPVEDRGIDFDTINVSMLGYNYFATYVAHLYTKQSTPGSKVEDSSAAQLCGRMLLTLSRENRYAFASAIANQLRYPEKHTYFFRGFILSLFTSFGERMFKEGISEARHVVTRALLERLMAHRPHPWGLMHTFSELLKSEKYNFREMPFIKSSPDVTALFSTLYAHIAAPELIA